MEHTSGPVYVTEGTGGDENWCFEEIRAPAGHSIGRASDNYHPFDDAPVVTKQQAKANAKLWAEALNVATEEGKSIRELQAERDELKRCLDELYEQGNQQES